MSKMNRMSVAALMVLIEINDPWLEDQLDRIADTLNNDERYRPAQFAAMLATLSEPQQESDDGQDE